MYKYFLLSVTAFMLLFVASAQHNGFTVVKDEATFNSKFATAAAQVKTIKSDFVQEKNLSLLAEKITSKGKFWFQQENKVRMEYTQPFQYLMVLNGTNVYIKDSQKENKISTRSNKLFQQINKLMVECMNGQALQSKDFKTKLFENGQFYLAEMVPVNKTLQGMFSSINLTISKKDMMVSKIDMKEPSGDNTLISFLQPVYNSQLDDALFAIR